MSRAKILIVEDERTLRNALHKIFKDSDYEVILAENGKVGLELANKHNPDILLVDIVMPVMDGDEMLEAYRATEGGANTPAIMLTNVDGTEHVAQALKVHASFLIKAQVKPSEVLAAVEDMLSIDNK